MPRPSARHLVMGFLLFASAIFLLYSLQGGGRPAGEPGTAVRERGEAEAGAGEEAAPSPAAPTDVGFDRYEELAARSPFAPRRAAPPPQKKEQPQKMLPPPPPPPPAEKKINLTGWTYVGYITLDERKLGIVQHESSTSVEFLEAGTHWLGAEVTEVTGEVIRFKSGTSGTTLSRERDFAVTPLGKAAAKNPSRRRPSPR
jgi:hypothetical protein